MPENVLGFRPFKIPSFSNQFWTVDDSKNIAFAKEDLARSGLDFDEMLCYTSGGVSLSQGAEAGYMIPYFDLKGQVMLDENKFPAMYRTRMKFPEFSRAQRYTQPCAEQLAKYGLPPYIPYVPPAFHQMEGTELICAEGEKKAYSIIRHLKLPAFGIGGCWLWKNPDGSGGIHPWIRDLIRNRGANSITIVPDGDIRRYDIAQAYGNFARALENEGLRVVLLEPAGKIDDLLIQWGAAARENWGGIQPISPKDLIQTPSALIKEFGLAFRAGADGRPPLVHQHISNVLRLMREHPAFPRIWRNMDDNRVYLDGEKAIADMTEVHICEYFQHNLGFDKAKVSDILKAIHTLSKENERSPFLEAVKNTEWDHVPRLDTWMTDLWGVSDSPFAREVAAKWLVSSCARMDKPGTKLDWMLIVIGPQATGKTTMPAIMFKNQNLTLYGEHNDKDLHMLLHSALCVGFDELDSFNRKESSNLKAMVTRNEDAFRPPYGSSVEVFQRRFTLYGCGNRHDFLQHDISGYRRYAIVEVPRLLDFKGLEAVRDQLWAEAWHRYQTTDCDYWRVEGANENAQNYVPPNPLQEQIEIFLARKAADKMAAPGPVYFLMHELQIALGLEKIYQSSTVIRDISQILVHLGCVKPTKASRNPDTKALGKWFVYEPKEIIE